MVDVEGLVIGDESDLLGQISSQVFRQGEHSVMAQPVVEPEIIEAPGGNPVIYLSGRSYAGLS